MVITDKNEPLTILVLEDSEIDFLVLNKKLKASCDLSLDIVWAENLIDLTDHLEGAHVIITDLSIPPYGGASLIKTIRKLSPNLPIFAYTANNDPRVIMEVGACGASGYILKDDLDTDQALALLLCAVGRAEQVQKELEQDRCFRASSLAKLDDIFN